MLAAPVPALAQTAPDQDASDTVFVLGRISAAPSDSEGQHIGGSDIGAADMRKLDAQTVDQAIDLVPGAVASNTGGSRNERLIYVRGFDRFQTTLSIDGVRVFLPADNRIDFGRFLTADIAEVQVGKGYTSVLDGPGGLGGAINLVTRKPSKPFEAEFDATLTGDRDLDWTGNTYSALLGTKQDKFYAQASGDISRRGNFTLSNDFTPVVPALEDGGSREHSSSNDWRVNLKAGWTPNDTDEYAISYIRQSGAKNAPYHVSDTTSGRYWSWPYWDIDSVYFLSRTQLAPNLNLKTRIYRNGFQNLLSAYDDASQTTQSLPKAFNSYYDDTAWGAEATLAWTIAPSNTLTSAVHFRNDEHRERQLGYTRTPPSGAPFAFAPYAEPWQQDKEDTYSIAAEDVQKLGPNVDLVTGLSYDWTDLKTANDISVSATGTTIANSTIVFTPVDYPLKDMHALNGQAALVWRIDPRARMHVSVSSRTRFPTIFERFSSRFGTAVPNPDVGPERATNYEVGATLDPAAALHFEGAVFYSDLQDALIQIPVALGPPFGTVNQTKNAGDASYYGAELEATADLAPALRIGGNATWIHRDFTDPTNPAFRPQGVPDYKLFLYADWRVLQSLTITPSIEAASNRWTVTSSSAITPPQFYKTGDYTLLNLAADWTLSPNVSLLAGVRNIGDANYQLVDGFPEEGRNVYLSLRLRN
ncbi:MAG: TonB-dependent receptor [Alphaproteobacteria bacterium]|nr:TonB-dependent receptor [Alphaproteobacteria bacterium]